MSRHRARPPLGALPLRVGALAVLLVLFSPHAPVLTPVLIFAFWLWWAPSALRFAVSRDPAALRPSAVNAAVGLAVLVVSSQVLVGMSADQSTRVTQGLALLAFGASWLSKSRAATGVEVQGAQWWRAPASGPTKQEWVQAALLAVALTSWLVSLRSVRLSAIDDFGLLPALPPMWYLGLVLCSIAAGYGALTSTRRSPLLPIAALALLVLILHATPAIAYELPRYTWTYKHLGVVDYISHHHNLPRSRDIYFNWPGFFCGAEMLSSLSGLSAIALARWSPPFFELLTTWGMWYLCCGLTADRRRSALATLVFVTASWVGQDYFSPQALAYSLALVLLGTLARTRTASLQGRATLMQAEHWTVVALLWLAIVTTHQLTPPVLLAVAAGWQVVWRLRNPWPLAAMSLIEVAWVALAWPYLSRHNYSLLEINPFHGSLSGLDQFTPSTGAAFRSYTVYALYFGLFAAGVGYSALRARRSRRDLAVGVAAACPALLLLVQDYGGEGQLRAYLFAQPFLCFLVAGALLNSARRQRSALGRLWGPQTTVLFMLGLFLPAYFGQEEFNHVQRSDVAVANWFDDHTAPGSGAYYIAPNAPIRTTENYLKHPLNSEASPYLTVYDDFLRAFSAEAAVSHMRKVPEDTYLIISPTQSAYLAHFGIAPRRRYDEFTRQVRESPDLQLAFRYGNASAWRLVRR